MLRPEVLENHVAIYGRVSKLLQGFLALRIGFPHFVELQVPRLFENLYEILAVLQDPSSFCSANFQAFGNTVSLPVLCAVWGALPASQRHLLSVLGFFASLCELLIKGTSSSVLYPKCNLCEHRCHSSRLMIVRLSP